MGSGRIDDAIRRLDDGTHHFMRLLIGVEAEELLVLEEMVGRGSAFLFGRRGGGGGE